MLHGDVNILAVLAAAVAPMVVGAIWYGPLFGKTWIQAHGYSEEDLAEMQKGMGKAYGISFIFYMVAMGVILAVWP